MPRHGEATTLHGPRRSEQTERDSADAPGLVIRSGRAVYDPSGRWLQVVFLLWMWPLPPPGTSLLDVEYPLIEVAGTGVELDGTALSTAGADARMLVE